MAKTVIRTKIPISRKLTAIDREGLAEMVISYIQERSAAGFDKNGNRFQRYSKEYAKFKGVGRGDVDLVLNGDMLMSLSLTNHGTGFIEIGYKDDDENAGKAEGNILGTYGQPQPVTKPRNFLGIDPAEIDIIQDSYLNNEDEISGMTEEELQAFADQAAKDIFAEEYDE